MTAEVKIFSRDLEVTDRINEYVFKKVSKLDRYLEDINEVRVDLASTNARSAKERAVAQITARGKGFILRSEERDEDIFGAVNLALETIKRRIKRYKGKRNERWKKDRDVEIVETFEDEDEEEPVIVRRKEFKLTPMDEWEAIEQMELLGHNSFFVFFNIQAQMINVLYKRHDGTYGLIEPEI
ncbi:MAG: ribosomal subunit interface protein [Anaerolinea sp. 4484_236]|nr:MAG: ribosomal subunit interface protein [Anaerolinea sp. 4484_236]OQY33908.1 MAG: ribosomal subunit interface protein [Anaerolineaceae bacterium 4572_5.2]RLD11523.1 MAG: ribosome-associated translation inhibitor RaiA [Chloroflexota bacterium]